MRDYSFLFHHNKVNNSILNQYLVINFPKTFKISKLIHHHPYLFSLVLTLIYVFLVSYIPLLILGPLICAIDHI
jgi:hypothetical protein